MTYRSLIYFQGMIMVASSMIFPFYILLLNNIGNSYTQFGWAYGLFALTSALVYPIIGGLSDRLGDRKLLLTYSFCMAFVLLLFPLVDKVWQVYVLQIIMGILGAVQRNTEKTALSRNVEKESAGKEIGKYHTVTSISGAIAIIFTGYFVDFVTIGSIFYLASFLYFLSSILLLKQVKK